MADAVIEGKGILEKIAKEEEEMAGEEAIEALGSLTFAPEEERSADIGGTDKGVEGED
jgi:hypothetical protein